MPSVLPLPTIDELETTFHDAVRGIRVNTEDSHAGSIYDHFAGVGAILWSQQAQNDKDQFEAKYFDRATGIELTDYVHFHDGIERILDTHGSGTIALTRASTSAGGGTVWKGTQITLFRNNSSYVYAVSQDTIVSALQTSVVVPIVATFIGPTSGGLYVNGANGSKLILTDPLWDNTWNLLSLYCSPGTIFEEAADFRARVKLERTQRRVGMRDSIATVCKSAGAFNVFLLQSNFAGDSVDYGINVAYVSDSGFNTSPELIARTISILESVRVLGADLQVLPMQVQTLNVNLTLNLWTDVSKVNSYEVKRSAISAIVEYFSNTSRFAYDLQSIAGSIHKLMPEIVQKITFTSPSSSAGILVSGSIPTILTKYNVGFDNVNVTLSGPI